MNDLLVGFFGQSGAGKTTIIKNLPNTIAHMPVVQHTGIIRFLFQVNSKKYTNPVKILSENQDDLNNMSKNDKITKTHEIYEKYIRSQLQLLNDFSTEVFMVYRETRIVPTVLIFDRSPVDFYALSMCGIKYLQDNLNKVPLNETCLHLLRLTKKTAEHNTNFLFNLVISTPPWQVANINSLQDGVRDQYLSDYYTGNNWYSKPADIEFKKTKLINLSSEIVNLDERVSKVVGIINNY